MGGKNWGFKFFFFFLVKSESVREYDNQESECDKRESERVRGFDLGWWRDGGAEAIFELGI